MSKDDNFDHGFQEMVAQAGLAGAHALLKDFMSLAGLTAKIGVLPKSQRTEMFAALTLEAVYIMLANMSHALDDCMRDPKERKDFNEKTAARMAELLDGSSCGCSKCRGKEGEMHADLARILNEHSQKH